MNSSIILSQKDIHLIHALHVQPDCISPLDLQRHQDLMRLTAQAKQPAKGLTEAPWVGLYDALTVNEIAAPPSNAMACRIVLPHEADLDSSSFSVLAPISIALLGRPLGSEVSFDSPGGLRTLRILSIEKDSSP